MNERRKHRVIRPPGLVVFGAFLVVVGLVWYFFADTVVERVVEASGESLVGAKVELESVELRPAEGSVRLRGLQIANPDAPMSNLVEAGEISVDLRLDALLEKKVVIQDLVMTGVRFNTARETSGALENPDPEAGQLWRDANAWADQITLPTLEFDGLSSVIDTDAIEPDSLRTVQHARALASRSDSLRTSWESALTNLDPRPRIDSVTAAIQRLEAFRPTPLNAVQIPGLLRDSRASLSRLTDLHTEIANLEEDVVGGVRSLRQGVDQFSTLRSEDLAYARGLLNIPTLEAPSISPAIFGGTALVWLKPVLYWANTAERFLSPGLDPRNRPGPQRARAEGTTVEFPGRATYPSFLVEQGDIELEIPGSGAAAGSYTAQIQDLTTTPAMLGRPMELVLGRQDGVVGPGGISLAAVIDHGRDVLRDSVSLSMAGVNLPDIDLGPFGGRLDLGAGDTRFEFDRIDDQLSARMSWSAPDPTWIPTVQIDSTAAPGSAEWARGLVWRAISGLSQVELEMALSGDIRSPSLSVTSNLGDAVANSLRAELGREIAAAEERVRAEVDRRIQPLVADVRGRVSAVQNEVAAQVTTRREEVEALRERLEQRIQALTGREHEVN